MSRTKGRLTVSELKRRHVDINGTVQTVVNLNEAETLEWDIIERENDVTDNRVKKIRGRGCYRTISSREFERKKKSNGCLRTTGVKERRIRLENGCGN